MRRDKAAGKIARACDTQMSPIRMNKNHPGMSTRDESLEAALDAALAESFPASDPIAINCAVAVALPPARAAVRPWKRSARNNAFLSGEGKK